MTPSHEDGGLPECPKVYWTWIAGLILIVVIAVAAAVILGALLTR